jgi:hypothetical protein
MLNALFVAHVAPAHTTVVGRTENHRMREVSIELALSQSCGCSEALDLAAVGSGEGGSCQREVATRALDCEVACPGFERGGGAG